MIKAVLRCSQEFNFSIDMQYVPSAENPADAPSRRQSDLDCTLSEEAWSHVQRLFGPHTFDLMSLDSNSRRDLHGNRLSHFTPCHTLSHPASTCLRNSCLSEKTFMFFPPLYLSVRFSVSLLTSIISTPSR